jgi:hypothetical protein
MEIMLKIIHMNDFQYIDEENGEPQLWDQIYLLHFAILKYIQLYE